MKITFLRLSTDGKEPVKHASVTYNCKITENLALQDACREMEKNYGADWLRVVVGWNAQ